MRTDPNEQICYACMRWHAPPKCSHNPERKCTTCDGKVGYPGKDNDGTRCHWCFTGQSRIPSTPPAPAATTAAAPREPSNLWTGTIRRDGDGIVGELQDRFGYSVSLVGVRVQGGYAITGTPGEAPSWLDEWLP